MEFRKPKDVYTHTVERPVPSFVIAVQWEHFRQGRRYHWTICETQNPDELISWGHAPTPELAETAALSEVSDLTSGLSQGGQVTSTVKPFTQRRHWHR